MKISIKESYNQNGFFPLLSNDWLLNQRIAGKVAAKILITLEDLVKQKTKLSLIELDNIAEKIIEENNCKPTFKGYRNFPASVCMSVNNQLVHGIPNEYKLQEGDLITFDVGVTYNESIADTAITCIYGNPKNNMHVKLINATNEALNKAIALLKVDKRIGDIGNCIYKSAKGNGFAVINEYGGHGISQDSNGKGILHNDPFIPNKSDTNYGIRIQPGLCLAIEPLLVNGYSTRTFIDKNKTVCCEDICAHAEHTVFIHKDSVEIITSRS